MLLLFFLLLLLLLLLPLLASHAGLVPDLCAAVRCAWYVRRRQMDGILSNALEVVLANLPHRPELRIRLLLNLLRRLHAALAANKL